LLKIILPDVIGGNIAKAEAKAKAKGMMQSLESKAES
jgi:hypothetical protein